MWYIYTMEYYSAIKKNKFMKFLGKWLDLEGIILSEVTQSQKHSNDMSCVLQIVTYILGILSIWANIHLSVSTYHVSSLDIGLPHSG